MSEKLKPMPNTLSQSKIAVVSLVSAIILVVGFLLWGSDGGSDNQLNAASAAVVKDTKVDANDLAGLDVQATFGTEPSEVDSNDDVEANYLSAMGEIGFYVPGTANYEDAWCEQWELNDDDKARATAEFTEFLDRNGGSLSEEKGRDGRPLNYQSYDKATLRELGKQGDLTALLGLSLHPESLPEEKLWAVRESLVFGATAPVFQYAADLILDSSARGEDDRSGTYIEAFAWADVAARMGDISPAMQLLSFLDSGMERARTSFYRPKLISDDDWPIAQQRADDLFRDIETARSDSSLPPLDLTQPKPLMRFTDKQVGELLAELSGKLPMFASQYISGTNCIEKSRQYMELIMSPVGEAMWDTANNDPLKSQPID